MPWCRRASANVGRGYVGRRVICEILGRAGVRVSELGDIRIGHVRLRDPDGARFRIPDSKTETGIREVQMSPELAQAVAEHIERLRRAGCCTTPQAYLLQSTNGGRVSRQRIAQIVSEGAAQAYAQLEQRVDRSHGESFDRLLRSAREQVRGLAATALRSRLGHEHEKPSKSVAKKPRREKSKSAGMQRQRDMARPRFELGTPRFSVVCSTN